MFSFPCGTRREPNRLPASPFAAHRRDVSPTRLGALVTLVALTLLVFTSEAWAATQSASKPAAVDLGVRVGQTVGVLTTTGFFDGKVVSVDATGLVIRVRTGPITLPVESIRLIDAEIYDSVANGALWGLATGAAFGGLAVARNQGSCGSSFSAGCGGVAAMVIAGSAAIGMGVGILGDLLHQSRHTVYRGPSRLSVVVLPEFAPHAAGVQAQLRW